MVARLNDISYPYVKDQNRVCNSFTAIILLFFHYGDFCQLFYLAVNLGISEDALPDVPAL